MDKYLIKCKVINHKQMSTNKNIYKYILITINNYFINYMIILMNDCANI